MARLRSWLAVLAFAAIGAGSFQPMYLTIFGVNGRAMAAVFTELPYRRLPGLRRLLDDVDRLTPPGARIAVWAPYREWEGGYGYAFRRAPYLLPGKRVLPMLEADRDQPLGSILVQPGRDDQGIGVFGGLEQPWHQHR